MTWELQDRDLQTCEGLRSEDQLCMSFPVQEIGAIRRRQEEQNLEQKKDIAPRAVDSISVNLLARGFWGFENFPQSWKRSVRRNSLYCGKFLS